MNESIPLSKCKKCPKDGHLMWLCDIEPSLKLPVRKAYVCEWDSTHKEATYGRIEEGLP